jgi:hypothetical protein
MALNVISLNDIIRSVPDEEDIKKLLFSFSSLKKQNNYGADDVEHFLHHLFFRDRSMVSNISAAASSAPTITTTSATISAMKVISDKIFLGNAHAGRSPDC